MPNSEERGVSRKIPGRLVAECGHRQLLYGANADRVRPKLMRSPVPVNAEIQLVSHVDPLSKLQSRIKKPAQVLGGSVTRLSGAANQLSSFPRRSR
jgi:hypothetical protein